MSDEMTTNNQIQEDEGNHENEEYKYDTNVS